MKKWFVSALIWVVKRLGGGVVAPPVDHPAAARVLELVQWAQSLPGEPSGEYKRHVVLAKLKAGFPETPTRELGWLIEETLRRQG